MSEDPKPSPVALKQSASSFWLTSAAIAAPLYYVVVTRSTRDDNVTPFGWILGYLVFVLLSAWLLRLVKLVLGSKLGRIAVLAYITVAFIFVFAVPFVSGKLNFRNGGFGAEIVAVVTLIGGFSVLFKSWGEEIKK